METGAVIVAAGMSSRMHRFKPMLKVGSITVVKVWKNHHCFRCITST